MPDPPFPPAAPAGRHGGGLRSHAGASVLAGPRYVLAVLLLAVLTSVPMLAMVGAGLAAIGSPEGGSGGTAVRPFITPNSPPGVAPDPAETACAAQPPSAAALCLPAPTLLHDHHSFSAAGWGGCRGWDEAGVVGRHSAHRVCFSGLRRARTGGGSQHRGVVR